MHPPGSQWISARASLLGIGACVLSVIAIMAIGLGVATYKVQDVNQRAELAARTKALAKTYRADAAKAGVWADDAGGDLVVVVPPDTAFEDVDEQQIILVQRPDATRTPASVIEGLTAETQKQTFVGETPKSDGFTYGNPTGRSLSDVVGGSSGVGIAVVLGSGDVLILQDETPVRDIQRFLTAESAAASDRVRYLETFDLHYRR